MKYKFVLTEQMKEDRFICIKDGNICKECSCRMSEDDCVFNHLIGQTGRIIPARMLPEDSQFASLCDS